MFNESEIFSEFGAHPEFAPVETRNTAELTLHSVQRTYC
jgi:hypothetical protein